MPGTFHFLIWFYSRIWKTFTGQEMEALGEVSGSRSQGGGRGGQRRAAFPAGRVAPARQEVRRAGAFDDPWTQATAQGACRGTDPSDCGTWCQVSIKKSCTVCFVLMCAGLVLVFTKSLQHDGDCLAHIPALFSLSCKCPLQGQEQLSMILMLRVSLEWGCVVCCPSKHGQADSAGGSGRSGSSRSDPHCHVKQI